MNEPGRETSRHPIDALSLAYYVMKASDCTNLGFYTCYVFHIYFASLDTVGHFCSYFVSFLSKYLIPFLIPGVFSTLHMFYLCLQF